MKSSYWHHGSSESAFRTNTGVYDIFLTSFRPIQWEVPVATTNREKETTPKPTLDLYQLLFPLSNGYSLPHSFLYLPLIPFHLSSLAPRRERVFIFFFLVFFLLFSCLSLSLYFSGFHQWLPRNQIAPFSSRVGAFMDCQKSIHNLLPWFPYSNSVGGKEEIANGRMRVRERERERERE